jgi:ABC-type transport system involved in multi-copper enzyme maturation permease subunit
MTNVIRAELYRLLRRRTLVIGGLVAIAFAFVASFAIFAAAEGVGTRSVQGGTSLARLAASGGGTESFAVGASFAALLAFVSAIALIGNEFSNGTFRSLALREPRRVRLIVGKFVGLLVVLAGLLLVAELLTFATSLLAAQWQDVPSGAWFSMAAIGDGLADFASTFAGLAGWMVFGTFLAVVFRSVPIALAVGVAWAGPFENITVDSWSTGLRVFPGQVLRSVIAGGTTELGLGQAILRSLVYVAVAAAITLTVVARRDITS